MAKESSITYFLGTDYQLDFTILSHDELTAIDITGWTLSFMIKTLRQDADADALLTNTTASITGTFSSDPETNTQVASVTIADTDTTSLVPGKFFWEFKRTTAGFETILSYGRIDLVRSVHR